MRKLITPILMVLSQIAVLHAQQAPQYSLYLLNPYGYNPAYAGLEHTLVATGVYRQQWTGLKGGPETQHINIHLPLYMLSSGIGLKVDNDAIGAHQSTQAVLSYNYQYELGKNALLSIGVSGGYMQYSLDGAKLRAPEGEYQQPSGSFSHNDPNLPQGVVSAGTPVFEAGIYFQWKELGVSLAAQPVFSPVLEAQNSGSFHLKPVRHVLAGVSYEFELGQRLSVKPALLVKTDLTETQTEISTVFHWRENIFAGASFRGVTTAARDAFVLLGGMRLNERTTIAYSYDIPLSSLEVAHRGSHELLLRYELGKPIGSGKLPPVIYNPRFF